MQTTDEDYIDGIRRLLTNKETLAELCDYAEKRIRRLNFMVGGNSTVRGHQAVDFVQEAIVTVLKGIEGRRKWDQQTDFLSHMKGIIKSQTSHAFESVESRSTQRESTISHFKADDEGYSLDDHEDSAPTPQKIAIGADAERKMWEIMGSLADDPLLEGIFQCLYDGVTKPADMAEELKCTTKEINNGKKRLGRRLTEYAEEQRLEATKK
ncbi:MAG: hypothetical protein Q7Q73_03925 [Verrucomicrobiota bacterium JB024]|nr:hypothetical protein [Verrucomicrobiota bacterium JB024]